MKSFPIKKHIAFLLIFAQIITHSCLSEHNETKNILKNFIGKQSKIPVTVVPQNFGYNQSSNDYLNSNLKLIVYLDSSSCTECRIRGLLNWHHFIDSIKNEKLKMVFVFNSDNIVYIKKILAIYEFKLPYFIDFENEFKKNNFLPEDPFYHTFLVNHDSVLIAGNPLFNPKLKELYIDQIDKCTKE